MPVSKRLKDGIQAYLKLMDEFQAKELALDEARKAEDRARDLVRNKASEIIAEMKVCAKPAANELSIREMLVEVDGRVFLLSEFPKDQHRVIPSYVQEMKLER